MVENGTIWNYFMKNEYIRKVLKVLDFSENSRKLSYVQYFKIFEYELVSKNKVA